MTLLRGGRMRVFSEQSFGSEVASVGCPSNTSKQRTHGTEPLSARRQFLPWRFVNQRFTRVSRPLKLRNFFLVARGEPNSFKHLTETQLRSWPVLGQEWGESSCA
jgi:hypothetical protein